MSDLSLYLTKLCLTVAKGDVPQIVPDQYSQSIHFVIPQQPQYFINAVRGISLVILSTDHLFMNFQSL